MKKMFIKNTHQLRQYTKQIQLLKQNNQKIICPFCKCAEYLVTHDFIYKKQRNSKRIITSKRFFCSNRYKNKGCGRTTRIYIANRIPKLHYSTHNIAIFIKALLKGKSISFAYKKATRCNNHSNAWRWINKINKKLIDFRNSIQHRPQQAPPTFPKRSTKLQNILTTMSYILNKKNILAL